MKTKLAVILLAALPALAGAEYKRNIYTSLLDYYEPAVNVSSFPKTNTENIFTKKNTFPMVCFANGTCQTTAGVASSTISVNATQFDGDGGSASPLSAKTSVFTLQGNDINISGLKTRVDNLDTSTAALTTRFTAVDTATATLTANLLNEANSRISGDAAVGISTESLKITQDAIAVTTGTLTVQMATKASLGDTNQWTGLQKFSDRKLLAQTRVFYSSGTVTPDSGYAIGQTVSTSIDQNYSGSASWTNPNNTKIDDGIYAQALGSWGDYFSVTQTNAGFSIPTNAAIEGVEISFRKNEDANAATVDLQCKLVVGGSATGNNGCNFKYWSGYTYPSVHVVTYGGPENMWGLALTPAQVNASNFGIYNQFTIGSVAGLKNAYIDYYAITVYYTAVPYWETGFRNSDPTNFLVKYGTTTVINVSSMTRTGIMNTAPAYTLDVGGNVNSTGGFFKNGVEVTGGSTNLSGVRYSTDPVSVALIDLSTVTAALAGKEPTITAGTTGQYWRGDKSWQTLPAAGFTPGSALLDNSPYGLTTSSDVVAHAYYGDGSHLSGIGSTGGGDNLGNHIATMTITAGYGVSASTISANIATLSTGTISTEVIFSTASAPTMQSGKGIIYFSTANVFMVRQNDGIDKPIVDPPGNWTCTIRSSAESTAISNTLNSISVSCSGSEKVISGGCYLSSGVPNGTTNVLQGAPSSQGWICTGVQSGTTAGTLKFKAYANCCQ